MLSAHSTQHGCRGQQMCWKCWTRGCQGSPAQLEALMESRPGCRPPLYSDPTQCTGLDTFLGPILPWGRPKSYLSLLPASGTGTEAWHLPAHLVLGDRLLLRWPQAHIASCGAGQLLGHGVVCKRLDGLVVRVFEDALGLQHGTRSTDGTLPAHEHMCSMHVAQQTRPTHVACACLPRAGTAKAQASSGLPEVAGGLCTPWPGGSVALGGRGTAAHASESNSGEGHGWQRWSAIPRAGTSAWRQSSKCYQEVEASAPNRVPDSTEFITFSRTEPLKCLNGGAVALPDFHFCATWPTDWHVMASGFSSSSTACRQASMTGLTVPCCTGTSLSGCVCAKKPFLALREWDARPR